MRLWCSQSDSRAATGGVLELTLPVPRPVASGPPAHSGSILWFSVQASCVSGVAALCVIIVVDLQPPGLSRNL